VISRLLPGEKPGNNPVTGSFFWYRHIGRITFHMTGAAFHHAVIRHTSRIFGTHSHAHALRAATTTLHAMVPFIHHHLMPAIWLTGITMMGHPADAASDKANEKDESYHDKKPGDKGKEFTGHILPEFCKQQGA
jgi:hypothetical protein